MSNEFEQVLEGVDLGEDALDAEELPTPQGEGGDKADEQVAESEEGPQEAPPKSVEAPEQPAKAPTKQQTNAVPLPIHLEAKHQLRDARMRLAQLEAEKLVPTAQVQTTPEKSPLEKFAETHEPDAALSAKEVADLLTEQRQWDQRQSQQQTAATTDIVANRAVAVAVRAMTEEVMGEGLGFETLLSIGNTFLTPGDIVDVKAAGPKAGELMYQRLLERTIRSNTPQGKLVKAAYKQARLASTAPSTPLKPKTGKAPAQAEAPTQEQILAGQTESIQGAGDLTAFFFGDEEQG